MAVIQGPEAVEQALANTLGANLNAELDAVWAAWGDAATVPKVYPVQVMAGDRSELSEYPVVVVQSISGDEVADGAPLYGEQSHVLEVTALCQSDDHHLLDIQTKRYLTAIWRVIKKNQQLDGSLGGQGGVSTMRYGRSNVYRKANGGLLLRAAAWQVRVYRIEPV